MLTGQSEHNSYGLSSEYYGAQYMQAIQQQQCQNQRNQAGFVPRSYTGLYSNDVLSKSEAPQKPKKEGFMKALKDYLESHKNIIFTVVLAVLADHFVFGGAFRERIKGVVGKLLDKADKQIGG